VIVGALSGQLSAVSGQRERREACGRKKLRAQGSGRRGRKWREACRRKKLRAQGSGRRGRKWREACGKKKLKAQGSGRRGRKWRAACGLWIKSCRFLVCFAIMLLLNHRLKIGFNLLITKL